MSLDDSLDYRQSQPCAGYIHIARPVEILEDAGELLVRDADPCVPDFTYYFTIPLQEPQGHRAPLWRELNGVAQQVGENLLQSSG